MRENTTLLNNSVQGHCHTLEKSTHGVCGLDKHEGTRSVWLCPSYSCIMQENQLMSIHLVPTDMTVADTYTGSAYHL